MKVLVQDVVGPSVRRFDPWWNRTFPRGFNSVVSLVVPLVELQEVNYLTPGGIAVFLGDWDPNDPWWQQCFLPASFLLSVETPGGSIVFLGECDSILPW